MLRLSVPCRTAGVAPEASANMNDRAQRSPAISSPGYDEFVHRYGLEILKEPGDLQIVDGDLAMTKDLDLMMGDKSYNALFRLAEHWRHNCALVAFLMNLLDLMVERHREANARLVDASEKDEQRKFKTEQFFFLVAGLPRGVAQALRRGRHLHLRSNYLFGLRRHASKQRFDQVQE
jgi:hypothetical protein